MNRRGLLRLAAAWGSVAFAPRVLGQGGTLTAAGVADAWLASLALIEMAAARARMLDPASPGMRCGINAFEHTRALIAPGDRAVTTPNNDTLYSNAFIDLTKGTVRLSVPAPDTRYQSVAIIDMFTNNNAVIGARTPDGPVGRYTLVGPRDEGAHPGRVIRVATPHAWVLGRTAVYGADDLAEALRLQGRLKLEGPAAGPYPQYATRDAAWPDYFRSADALLASDPAPSPTGLAALALMRARSPTFDRAGFGADAVLIDQGVEQARAFLKAASAQPVVVPQNARPGVGGFGDDFRTRARVALNGLGALPQAEAKYLPVIGPGGRTFDDDRCYRLTLPAALPVDGFWSITMYELAADGQAWLTDNPIGRHSIGDRTRGLKVSADGMIHIWISRTAPTGERRANWLPAPQSGPYRMSFRAYLPRPEMRDAGFRLPLAEPCQ